MTWYPVIIITKYDSLPVCLGFVRLNGFIKYDIMVYVILFLLQIVNCSSAESFQKMQIYNIQDWFLSHRLTPANNPVSVIRKSQLRQGYRAENADIVHFHFLKPTE